MGGSSSSSTRRTYNTTNVSQQGEGANVAGDGNSVIVERADAVTLDNIAAMHGDAFAELLDSQGDGLRRLLEESGSAREDSLMFAGEAFAEVMEAMNTNSDRLQDMARQTTGNLTENASQAMDAVAEANTSEDARLTQNAMLAAVLLVGFIAWRQSV